MDLLPVQLKLTDHLVVVVGGGLVGQRKARSALAAGARVRIVDRKPRPLQFCFDSLDWQQDNYHARYLQGAQLVFAAASEQLNALVVEDSRRLGIWVCDAACPARGDFQLPAIGQAGPIAITVSTNGAAPAAAQFLRDQLLLQLDDPIRLWIELLAEIRATIQSRIPNENARHQLMRDFSDSSWLDRVRQLGADTVREQMLQRVHQATTASEPDIMTADDESPLGSDPP